MFEDQVLPSGSRHTVSSSLGGERGSHRAVLSNGGPPHIGGRGAAQGASMREVDYYRVDYMFQRWCLWIDSIQSTLHHEHRLPGAIRTQAEVTSTVREDNAESP